MQCYVSQASLLPEERKVFCRYVASVCSVRAVRVCAIAHRLVDNILVLPSSAVLDAVLASCLLPEERESLRCSGVRCACYGA
jgi:hypothetical protein